MNFEIIPICPRSDYGGIPAQLSQDDTPTVAENCTPYATAQAVKPLDNAEISLSKISKAWAHTTSFYLEM